MLSALGMRAGSFRVSSGSTRASREARLACQGSVILTPRLVVGCLGTRGKLARAREESSRERGGPAVRVRCLDAAWGCLLSRRGSGARERCIYFGYEGQPEHRGAQ